MGPMVENGALYSVISFVELHNLGTIVVPEWNGDSEPVPLQFAACPLWKHGACSHASSALLMLGSVLIYVTAQLGVTLAIRSLVIDVSSKWIIGRDVKSNGYILQLSGYFIEMPNPSSGRI